MSDINNKDFSDQNPEHSSDNASLENDTTVNQTEGGTTYWETGILQNTNEANEQEPSQASYEYSQNNQEQTENNYSLYEAPQKKKSRKAPVIAAMVIVLLVAFSVTAFAFSDKIKNTLSMMTKSPAEYYAYVENKSVEETMDKMIKYMDASGVGEDIAVDTSTKLSYDKATVSALLQSSLGMSIEDLESVIGLSLDSIGFDVLVAMEGNNIYEELGVKLNDIDIISAELFMDYVAKEMTMRFPELSTAYLSQSLDMSEYGVESFNMGGYNDFLKLLASDRTTDFAKRYTKIFTDEVKDVELTKGENLTVGDITVKANKLTITFSEETLTNIANKVLEEAKDDKYLFDLVSSFGVTKEQYVSEIDKALADVKSPLSDFESDEEIIIMNVYVDGEGNEIGQNLKFKDYGNDIAEFGYSNVEQNNKGEYEFYVTDPASSSSISVSGDYTNNNGAYTGLAVVDFFAPDSGLSNVSINVKYEDVKQALKSNRLYTYGKINISSIMMMGMEIGIEYDVDGEQQLSTITLNMGSSPLVTLESSAKYLDKYELPKPDSNATTYDSMTESDAYSSTINIEEYISDLSDKLGVDLESLFSTFFPTY